MSELMDKQIGAEGGVKLSFVEGKLKLELMYDGKGGDAGVFLMLEPDYFMDKLKDVIPGDIDDKIIDMLKMAFKVVG